MNLLVLIGLAEEEFRLLAKLHNHNYSCLVFFCGFSCPLNDFLASFMAIVLENTDSIHTVADHHVDELLIGALVEGAEDACMSLVYAQDGG